MFLVNVSFFFSDTLTRRTGIFLFFFVVDAIAELADCDDWKYIQKN